MSRKFEFHFGDYVSVKNEDTDGRTEYGVIVDDSMNDHYRIRINEEREISGRSADMQLLARPTDILTDIVESTSYMQYKRFELKRQIDADRATIQQCQRDIEKCERELLELMSHATSKKNVECIELEADAGYQFGDYVEVLDTDYVPDQYIGQRGMLVSVGADDIEGLLIAFDNSKLGMIRASFEAVKLVARPMLPKDSD